MKTIFWCVDAQKDFMNKDGKLYVQGAEAIKGNLKKITDHAKKNKIKVVSTGDYHTIVSKEISKFPDFKATFPEHCMVGTEGMDFIPETDSTKWKEDNYILIDYTLKKFPMEDISRSRNIILYKDHFNIFDEFAGNPWALNTLLMLNPDTVIVYGVATNVCVDYAVLGLIDELCTVIVIKDAIKELPGCDLEAIYKKWRDAGAKLIDTNTLLSAGVQ